MSFKDRIDGNELDLSLNQLTEVPVKELAAASKATHLDISCNHIQILPNDFATLTHLVKIDLSKNRLTELPANFGNLLNLQYLDLYGNQIVDLPVSFCRLKNLRWLDLKNNPLEVKLKTIAGDCLNEKECQACAKKVVAYVQSIESDQEREKQKRLKVVREREAIEKAKVERELEEQRRLKKQEKEKRKAESRAKREAQIAQGELENEKDLDHSAFNERIESVELQENRSLGCMKLFMYFTLPICLALVLGVIWSVHKEIISTTDIKYVADQALNHLQSFLSDTFKLIIYYIPKAKEFFLKIVHRYMMNVTHVASQIEQILALYF